MSTGAAPATHIQSCTHRRSVCMWLIIKEVISHPCRENYHINISQRHEWQTEDSHILSNNVHPRLYILLGMHTHREKGTHVHTHGINYHPRASGNYTLVTLINLPCTLCVDLPPFFTLFGAHTPAHTLYKDVLTHMQRLMPKNVLA